MIIRRLRRRLRRRLLRRRRHWRASTWRMTESTLLALQRKIEAREIAMITMTKTRPTRRESGRSRGDVATPEKRGARTRSSGCRFGASSPRDRRRTCALLIPSRDRESHLAQPKKRRRAGPSRAPPAEEPNTNFGTP